MLINLCCPSVVQEQTNRSMEPNRGLRLDPCILGTYCILVDLLSCKQSLGSGLLTWRWTKKPLDESERGEWKSWLKAQHSENEDHGIWSHYFMANRWGNSGNSVRFYFWGAPKSLQMVTAAMKLKDAYSLEGKLWPT